jgi:hypothetical protein
VQGLISNQLLRLILVCLIIATSTTTIKLMQAGSFGAMARSPGHSLSAFIEMMTGKRWATE